jgi:UDP-glucose 4-epimerase
VPTREAPRRAGDPAVIVADPSQIKEIFDWQPKYDDLDEIVRTAYAWEKWQNSV